MKRIWHGFFNGIGIYWGIKLGQFLLNFFFKFLGFILTMLAFAALYFYYHHNV